MLFIYTNSFCCLVRVYFFFVIIVYLKVSVKNKDVEATGLYYCYISIYLHHINICQSIFLFMFFFLKSGLNFHFNQCSNSFSFVLVLNSIPIFAKIILVFNLLFFLHKIKIINRLFVIVFVWLLIIIDISGSADANGFFFFHYLYNRISIYSR